MPEPYQEGDYLGFQNILPPGTDGTANGPELLEFLTLGTFPAGWINQAEMYSRLVYNAPGLSVATMGLFFKDASFGSVEVASTFSPPLRPGVVIQRDAEFGVPHVYGETRADTIYGAGYATAEDRLFFMDVLRHAGRGTLSAFAGGSNRGMDMEQWRLAPYTEADLTQQAERLDDLYGADGAQVQVDAQGYVDGINAYIAEALINPTKMPGEYEALQQVPQPFVVNDVIATASLIGGIFGKGGGGELNNALVLQAAQKRFGRSVGKKAWADFREQNDPEAPTTVIDKPFPYQTPAGPIRAQAVAMPDPGSLTGSEGTGPASASALGSAPTVRGGLADGIPLKAGNSNALLVSGDNTDSGNPIAVFGPQVAYFIPQILLELDLHCIADCAGPGPDIDARGAAFPGISLYILLGRGPDFAWSATSAGQDIIDTFAEELCEPDGSEPTLTSNNYLYKSECLPMEVLERTNVVTPNPADQCDQEPSNPCGPYTMTAYRTVHGIVSARGTVRGKPVAYANQRSTYMHEADSARAFVDLNSPERVDDAQSFQQAASKIGFTFNWFYSDDRDVAYFNSGDNPVRGRGTDPNFPTWGTGHYDWENFDPAFRNADYTPFEQHPQAINQDYITSWNNKQAPNYSAAEDNYAYGPIHRSLSLDRRIEQGLSGGGNLSLVEVVDAMEDAGTVDLRGREVLPYMLDVLGTPSDPQLATAVGRLQDWLDDGAHRREAEEGAHVYEHAVAIQIMDAWWPRVLDRAFKPAMGQQFFDSVRRVMGFDNDPNGGGSHLGSAYIAGWYGYLQKDLRSVLGLPVEGAFSRKYCGFGDLAACRTALEQSLSDALPVTLTELYDEDPGTAGLQRVAGCPFQMSDQWCWDSVRFRPTGAVTYPTFHWINRPTFQQANQILGHRPR